MRAGLWKVFATAVAGVVLAMSVWQGMGYAQPKPAASEPKIADDLADLERALEAKDYATFIEKYVPVEDLRQIRKQNILNQVGQQFAARPESAKLLALVKKLKTLTPTYDPSKGEATFTMPELVGTDAESIVPPDPTGKPGPGYGGDLKAVLAACVVDIDKADWKTFVAKMYPAREAARLQDSGELQTLIATLDAHPGMREQLRADLKQMQALQPRITGNVAEFTLKRRALPDRTVKLQKSGADWRFFDNSAAVTAEIQKIAALKLPDFKAASDEGQVRFERIGGNWRFVKMPRL